jgi:hypothetical protein
MKKLPGGSFFLALGELWSFASSLEAGLFALFFARITGEEAGFFECGVKIGGHHAQGASDCQPGSVGLAALSASLEVQANAVAIASLRRPRP